MAKKKTATRTKSDKCPTCHRKKPNKTIWFWEKGFKAANSFQPGERLHDEIYPAAIPVRLVEKIYD